MFFMSFALLCLLCSSLWHTMSGCAHRSGMEFCARVDYVGIGWYVYKLLKSAAIALISHLFRLISASVATVVHHGFSCHPKMKLAFMGLCLLAGIAGSIFPFVKWFNQFEYRVRLSPCSFLDDLFIFIAAVVPYLLLRRTCFSRCRSCHCIIHIPLIARGDLICL
jgi:predicted membrane channel-forming protein YqfA (hemolysin III family)